MKKINKICQNCWRWEEFKVKCDFWYEGKRECSKFSLSESHGDKFVTEFSREVLE